MARKEPPELIANVMSYGQPPLKKSEDYLKAYEGYQYSAISAIANDLASIQLKLFEVRRGGKNKAPETQEILEHEAMSTLEYVNDFSTFFDLAFATSVYLDLVGEAFWVILRENGEKGAPIEIWPLRPDWVTVVPDKKKVVAGYKYRPGGIMTQTVNIPVENMIHFKEFNPMNPYRGKGRIQSASMPIDIYNFSQEWNRNFFFNSAMPGMVFISDEKKVNAKAVERFMKDWQNKFQGRDKSHKMAFLSGGFRLEKTNMGARELDFTEQQKMLKDDILANFQVPKTILGLTENVNRANAEATTRAYMERVVTPRMIKFTGALTEFYLPMFDDKRTLFFDFVDPSPEDVETKLKVYANARQYGWMTANEIRVQENLEPLEGGDTLGKGGSSDSTDSGNTDGTTPDNNDNNNDDGNEDDKKSKGFFAKLFGGSGYQAPKYLNGRKPKFKHMMPIPARKASEIKKERFVTELATDIKALLSALYAQSQKQLPKLEPEIRKEQNEEDLWTEEAKDAFWNDFIRKAQQHEDEYKEKLIAMFKEQEIEVLANLDTLKYWNKDYRKGKIDEILFNLDRWVSFFHSNLIPFIREMIIDKGNEILDFLGISSKLDIGTDNVAKFIREQGAEKVKNINETTLRQLKEELEEGLRKEESISQLKERIQRVYVQATGHRAETIARTESLRANNFATQEAYLQSDVVKGKKWLATRDTRTREAHSDADEQVVKLNEAFTVGGEKLMYPGDPNGSAENTINCRCTQLPVIKMEDQ